MSKLIAPSDLTRALRGQAITQVKPNYHVTVNWSDSLSRGLVFYAPFIQTQGQPLDIVTKATGDPKNGAKWLADKYHFDGTNDYLEFADNDRWDVGSSAFTVRCRCVVNGYNNTGVIFGKGKSGNPYTAGWVFRTYTGGVQAVVRDSGGTADIVLSYATAETGIERTWDIRFDPTGTSYLYRDGVQVQSATGNPGNIDNSEPVSFGYNYGTSGVYANVDVIEAQAFNRLLSTDELAILGRDPYRLLKPANDSPYLLAVPAAVGGVTEIPSPLHNLDNQYATIMASKLGGLIQE